MEEYTTSGALVTKTLITGLPFSAGGGVAVSGGDLFVADGASNVSEYTTSGTLVNPHVANPFAGALFVSVDGSDLYTEDLSGISEYTTSGTLLRSDFISGGFSVFAIDGSDFLVSDSGSTVAEYSSSGSLVTSTFASGLSIFTTGIAVVGATATVPEGPWNALPYLGAAAFGLLLVRRRQRA